MNRSPRNHLARAIRRALGAAALVVALAPASVSAAVISPTTTADEYATNPDACSLREAVAAAEGGSKAANAVGCTPGAAGEDTIRLAPGSYELTLDGADATTVDLAVRDLEHSSPLAVEALPGGPVAIDANGIDRIFQTLGGGLRIDGVTLTGGAVGTPEPNTGVTGGAIASAFTLPVVITNGAVIGNTADSTGGAIVSQNLTLRNVTVSGNSGTGPGPGGAINVSGTGSSLTLDHVTIADNQTMAQQGGGGLSAFATTSSVRNSIIAGNRSLHTSGKGPDCLGGFSSEGGNVIGDSTDCTVVPQPGDAFDVDAMLGALADNGGGSPTHAVPAGSPADGRGPSDCEGLDQRGLDRPTGGCDAGAYEGPWVALTATDPASPADENTPMVLGAAQSDSSVAIHADPGCAAPPIATATASELAAGVEISVPDESTTELYATATDARQMASACTTEPLTYVERATPPAPPAPPATPADPATPDPVVAKRCRKGFKLKKLKPGKKGKKAKRRCVRVKRKKRG